MTDRDPLDRLKNVADQPVQPDAAFEERLLTDLLRTVDNASPITASPATNGDGPASKLLEGSNMRKPEPKRLWFGAAAAVIVGVLITLALTRDDDGNTIVTDEPPASEEGINDDNSETDSTATPQPTTSTTDQQIDVGPAQTTTSEDATLRVLSSRPPLDFSLDWANALPPVTEPSECVGCIDLFIVPVDWIPVGESDYGITVSVQPPGFTFGPDAEQLTIRGTDATTGSLGGIAKLGWTESDGVTVVVTFGGYSRDDAIAVAEGLILDGLENPVQAGFLPDGAKAVSDLFGGPTTLMQYSSTDGQQLVIEAFSTDQSPTEEVRNRLSELSSATDLVVRPDGVGSVDPFQPERSFIWWSNDGLILRIDRARTDLDIEQLADFAVTLNRVSNSEWAELGGN